MVAMVVSVLFSGRDHRSPDGGPWPGERSTRSRQARSAAKDGGRRLFCLARNAATSRQGKKAGVAVAGRRSRRSRPSGLIRPFEDALVRAYKRTDGDHHDCRHRRRTRTGITDRTKTCLRASTKAKARAFRTTAHDFASRAPVGAAMERRWRSPLIISMSEIDDAPAVT